MIRWNIVSLILFASFALLCAPRPVHAAESYDNCTAFVTSLPAVITVQGTWCLKKDLITAIANGAAITIGTDNVILDCNNFKVEGSAGSATQSTGIYAVNRNNLTVRHCDIRGFRYGALMTGAASGGHIVEDNYVVSNRYLALRVDGSGSVVRRNFVFNTGQSDVQPSAYGIYTSGDVDVQDNTVSVVVARQAGHGMAMGIYTDANVGGSVIGNRVRGVAGDGIAGTYGIFNGHGSNYVSMRNNDLIGNGRLGSIGLNCDSASDYTKGNAVSGFATGIGTCSDDGGNVIVP